MKITKALIVALSLAAALTACDSDKNDNPAGSWTASAPHTVTDAIAGAKSAVKTVSIDFNKPIGEGAGQLTLTADYDVTLAKQAAEAPADTTYKVRATIKGTWTQDVDDHDDYLLTFDRNSLSVAGVDAPELGPVTDDFLNSLAPLTTIEDVEVSKDGTHLTFEAKHPDVKYHFVKK